MEPAAPGKPDHPKEVLVFKEEDEVTVVIAPEVFCPGEVEARILPVYSNKLVLQSYKLSFLLHSLFLGLLLLEKKSSFRTFVILKRLDFAFSAAVSLKVMVNLHKSISGKQKASFECSLPFLIER